MAKRKDLNQAIGNAKDVQATARKMLYANEVANQATGIINACAEFQTAAASHKAAQGEFEKNTGSQVLQLAQVSELGSFLTGMELAAKAWKAANAGKAIPAHFTQYKSDIKAGFELGLNYGEYDTYSKAKQAINAKRKDKAVKAENTTTIEVDKELKALITTIVDAYHKDRAKVAELAAGLMPELQAILAVLPAPADEVKKAA